jgi:hypothetical protein
MNIDRQTVFNDLISRLMDPASNATDYAKNMLKLDQSAIPTLINDRMNHGYPFFNSFNPFMFNAAQTEKNERDFARMIQERYTLPVDFPDLWVAFVNGIRIIMQEQIEIVQQRKRKTEIEPVLGPVNPMPPGISLDEAIIHENAIKDLKKAIKKNEAPSSMSIPRPKGGKKSRSKKRGRKSVHRRNKSAHNKRR